MNRVAIIHAAVGLLTLATAALAHAADGPLVITRGGTYRGQWTSDDANVPVITIKTKEPVVIERSTLVGRGKLIDADAGGADVTVRDVQATALNPNIVGRSAGRFFTGDGITRLVIEHCRLDGTSGIYIHRWSADANAAEITIRGNDVRNIDGRRSDGHEGYLLFNRRSRPGEHAEDGFDLVQFVQFDQIVGLPHGEIAWNRVVNEPGRSRVEDNVSLYESSGVAGGPIRIHDNLIVGAYTIDPARPSGDRDRWHDDWGYSGGGIMLGDGAGASLATASGFLEAVDNVVLSTGNYGIAVAGGHDIRVDGNRVFASGRLADGRMVLTQNVGIYVWDIAKGKQRQPATFFNVIGTHNTVGWWNVEKKTRNDWWTPDATEWSDNVNAPGPISAVHERREMLAWVARAKATAITPGVRPTDAKAE